jgi:hypothetical protein
MAAFQERNGRLEVTDKDQDTVGSTVLVRKRRTEGRRLQSLNMLRIISDAYARINSNVHDASLFDVLMEHLYRFGHIYSAGYRRTRLRLSTTNS